MIAPQPPPKSRLARLLIVLTGILLGQAVLYGPALLGRKILLPLDILALPTVYLPQTAEVAKIGIHNNSLSDLIYHTEPSRRFGASEFRAGRLPMWAPYHYGGAPFIWPKFSPFLALECCTASPVVLAWSQLLAALVTGLGAFLFCRRVLAVGFWPAAIAALVLPLTAFFVFWQGYATSLPVVWLPWLLLAVDRTVRGATVWAPVGLCVATALVLTSGQLDVGGQVLLASGLYALWCLGDTCYARRLWRRAAKTALTLAAAWGLGLLLAAPYILPVLEYTHTGARMARRSAGDEERPPGSLAELPQTVLPYMYGSRQTPSVRLVSANEMETSAATYAGIFATLFLTPLAWCSRRHRSLNLFWAFLSLLSLSWSLDLPVLVSLLRLPGLNMMSHNRLVFLAAFAILAMMAVGLDVFLQGALRWRWWLWLPVALLAGLCAWCVYRAVVPPEPVATQLLPAVQKGYRSLWIHDENDVRRVQDWFASYYTAAAVLCGLGLLSWFTVWSRRAWQVRLFPLVAALLLGDLLWFGYGRSPQCDPALYFPRIPALEQVAQSAPGRVMGVSCLPASLAPLCGLSDVRGYDGVDPARITDLLSAAADPQSRRFEYAATQWLTPKAWIVPGPRLRFSPLLDMLNVRYLIGRGAPPPEATPAFQSPDYWVLVNSRRSPRAFVPTRVETVEDDPVRLEKLSAPAFDPRRVAYVESPVNLPGPCRGVAEITQDTPVRVLLSVHMETPGLLVLADRWDKGWQARLNGQPVPILRANHALRGVLLPAGAATLDFRYAPASFAWGLRLAALALLALLFWLALALRRHSAHP